ncbi:MAG: caspase family protein [Acidobacteriota bacterium]
MPDWNNGRATLAALLLVQLWVPPPTAAQEEGPAFVLQNGHSSAIRSLAISPNGESLASGSDDRTVKLWQVETGKLIRTLEGHTEGVNSVAFSPNGRLLASGSGSVPRGPNTVKLWEVATGNLLRTLEGHRGFVKSVAFSPNGRLLASGGVEGTVKLWEVATGKLLRTLEGHGGSVKSVAFSPEGHSLASASDDSTVMLWDLATGTRVNTLEGHTEGVNSVAFSPAGQSLASGSNDRTVRLWEAGTGRPLRTLEMHESYVTSVAFSPEGRRLASTSWDRKVGVWEVRTGKLLRIFVKHNSFVTSVAFSPDGQKLASGDVSTRVKLWEAETGQVNLTLEGQSNAIRSVAYAPGGETLAAASADRSVKLWDVKTGKLIRTFERHNRAVVAVAFSPDGRKLASGSDDRTVRLWQVSTGEMLQRLEGFKASAVAVAFSPDGQSLATGSVDQTLKLWDVQTGEQLRTFEGHGSSVFSVAFSPDGGSLVSGSDDQTVKLWNVQTGELLRTFEKPNSFIGSVVFSPDGQKLASDGAGNSVDVWEVRTGKRVHALDGHSRSVFEVAFSPDGTRLATASVDRTVKLWQVATGELLRTLEGHSSTVFSLAFSPDGTSLASGSADTSIRRWQVSSGELLATSYAFGRDYLTLTPEGFYVASEGGEQLAAWRVDGELYGFERYAERFNRPGLVAQRLEGRSVQTPGDVQLATDRPPTLTWSEPFPSTRDARVRLLLKYEGTSQIQDLVVVFNNEPLAFQPQSISGQLEIPLKLSSRINQLVAVAFDSKRLKSEPLRVRFEYLGASDDDAMEMRFSEALPHELLTSESLKLNRQPIDISEIDAEGRTVRFLGGKDSELLRQGVNLLETTQARFRFWWEEQKLIRMPEPYEESYAVIAAIDDYDRERDPQRGPTGFDALEDMVGRARELEEALIAVGFPRENIVSLYDRDATSTNIRAQLQRFWEGGDLSGADRLFFYFGGHGAGPEGHGYLITYDHDPKRPTTTSFLMSDIVGRHFPFVEAKHLLVALDSCSSGLAIPGFQKLDGLDERRLKRFRNLTVILGDTEEKARNLLVAGTGDEPALYVNGGIFTQALIDSLRGGGDWNSDGVIQFEELALQLRNEVRDRALQTGVQQLPAYYVGTAHGNGRVLFLTP